jgi:hypothetical protein
MDLRGSAGKKPNVSTRKEAGETEKEARLHKSIIVNLLLCHRGHLSNKIITSSILKGVNHDMIDPGFSYNISNYLPLADLAI